MTPLFHRTAKELTLPVKDRRLDDQDGLLARMDDIHCFEISAVDQLAKQLAAQYPVHGVQKTLMFLPAPKTWIEMATDWGRQGFLIEDGDEWRVTQIEAAHNGLLRARGWFFSKNEQRLLPIRPQSPVADWVQRFNKRLQEYEEREASSSWFHAILAIINTPRIIGRKQHMPHRGLEKRLLATRGLVGKFPLHAWTEIVLQVRPPQTEPGEPREAHFTGERAYHFCRCHLRIRLGRLELVSAHWRGDPALGIKQTRYRLEMHA